MNRLIRLALLASLLWALLVWMPPTAAQMVAVIPDDYGVVLQRRDLPASGTFVPDPRNASTVYYFTRAPRAARKNPGLYRSGDGGKSFKLLCPFLKFERLFIHPDTGRLFAIVGDEYLAANRAGFLTPAIGNKVVASDDGRLWKDITGKPGYLPVHGIETDPTHPGRIRLEGTYLRGFLLEALDDEYTGWKQIPGGGLFSKRAPARR